MEKLQNVVKSLPHMSKDIVDDTIHEKVLSYLSEYASQGPEAVAKFLEWNILDIIHTCIVKVHENVQDCRIMALSIRFLARLLANDDRHNTPLFSQLYTNYIGILYFILDNAFNEAALMRYSCIEALEQIVTYNLGAKWFLESNKSHQIVAKCYDDSSTYVTVAASKLLLSIINSCSLFAKLSLTPNWKNTETQDALMEFLITSLDLFNKINQLMFDSSVDISRRLEALQLIWTLANSRTNNAIEFLKQGHLLNQLNVLLTDPDRNIRARANDILCIVLEWVPDPISLFKKSGSLDTKDSTTETLNYIINDFVFPLWNTDSNFEMVTMAVNVLESSIRLVERVSKGKIIVASVFMDLLIFLLSFATNQENPATFHFEVLYENGTFEKLKKLFHTKRNFASRKSLILNILHTIRVISQKNAAAVANTSSICVILDILFMPEYNTDQRIMKEALSIIPVVLFTKIDYNKINDQEIVNKTLQTIQFLALDSKIECRGMILLLEAMQKLLCANVMGRYILNSKYGKEWADTLIFRACDLRWDIRDSILEFIGGLLDKSSNVGSGVNFVLKYDLSKVVFAKINDEEPYVRASCLKAIKNIIRNPKGWQYVVSGRMQEDIALKLPSMMRDSEAFVRRAVMELMVCFIVERDCGTILLDDRNAEIMNPKIIDKIMDDPDFYVRISGCQFLASIWDHCEQDRLSYGQKRTKHNKSISGGSLLIGQDSSWFYWLEGDKLLVAAAEDSSRLVRDEVLVILKRLKYYLEKVVSNQDHGLLPTPNNSDSQISHKRLIDESTSLKQKHYNFYQNICLIDFERLEATIDVEHLYKEALESVSTKMMIETDMMEDGNDDYAMDCYF
ncbi:armadillo-type protein [Glomus cerebriforme]|uniref:Armadillo-type protein n=1 Tax=Glomus cerebriforme TaxID=658196 RepID=A0A397SND0_9GLOM|nr:armadillo-type protein [Glomus cerebriforme]